MGATNFFVTPYAFALVATPMGGGYNFATRGAIASTGRSPALHFTIHFSELMPEIHSVEAGGFYENSTGEGQFNGNWAGVLAGLHYRF